MEEVFFRSEGGKAAGFGEKILLINPFAGSGGIRWLSIIKPIQIGFETTLFPTIYLRFSGQRDGLCSNVSIGGTYFFPDINVESIQMDIGKINDTFEKRLKIEHGSEKRGLSRRAFEL